MFDAQRATRDGFKGWGVLLGIPALFVLAFYYPLIPYLNNAQTCAVKHFLHIPCPGCGLTSSFIALTHGNIRASLAANSLGIIIASWLFYIFGRAVFTLIFGKRPNELMLQGQRDVVLYVFLVVMILQWILKSIF